MAASSSSGNLLENSIPCVKFGGIITNKDVTITDDATVVLPSTTTIGGSAVVALGDITSPSTSASAFTVTNSGVFTGASVVAITANTATTGTVTLVTANGLTTGHALTVSSSGVIVTTGDLLAVTASGATTSTGVVRITTAALTTGAGLLITANALTSGNAIRVQSSSTDTTAHNLIHAINSGAASVASLFGGTQVVISTHFRKILTESGSGVTLYFSDGTTANSALTGVAGDICFNAGSNKPEYCTGTTSWTALV